MTASELAEFKEKAKTFAASPENITFDAGKRLEVFLAVQGGEVGKKSFGKRVKGDVSTVFGRQAIQKKVQAATAGKSGKSKLKMLDSIFGEGLVGLAQADKLLAAKYVIMSCEGILCFSVRWVSTLISFRCSAI